MPKTSGSITCRKLYSTIVESQRWESNWIKKQKKEEETEKK